MTLYECDFCGKRTVNENEIKKLSMTLGDLTFNTKDICLECSRRLDKAITDLKMQRLEEAKAEASKGKSTDYGESFRVVDMGDGEMLVTRADSFAKDGRKLTRADIYRGRWEEAASEYAHAFICGGFPTKPDPERPSEEEWMAEEPYPHEVDRYITDKMFPGKLTHGGTDNENPKANIEKGIAYMKEHGSAECSDDQCCCGEECGDNREVVIEEAKKHLMHATNIESSPDEMKCLDSFLFRCWQMNWLRYYDDTQPKYDAMRMALCIVKKAFETDVIYAPGEKPTYEQADKAREVYKAVCDALGKKGVKKAKFVSKS